MPEQRGESADLILRLQFPDGHSFGQVRIGHSAE